MNRGGDRGQAEWRPPERIRVGPLGCLLGLLASWLVVLVVFVMLIGLVLRVVGGV